MPNTTMPDAPIAARHPIDILIVDDDPGHVELVRRNLQRAGVTNRLVALDRGDMALDYVRRLGAYRDRPGDDGLLILLDINMPGRFNGVEVLRQLKADPATRSIPVLMLTTTDDPREVERCYALGCSVYIAKPVAPLAFVEAIRRLGLFLSVVRVPGESPLEGV